MSTKAAARSRQEHLEKVRRDSQRGHRRRVRALVWTIGLTLIAAVVTVMMLNSRPETSTASRTAPDFTLTDTAGKSVALSSFRGHNVLLYFSEGAGCQACLAQMGELEKNAAALNASDVTVLPVVMNTRDQITRDMTLNGVRTPFLLDDGTVSKAYGTLGKGMHAGLPGHSFVLIDKNGTQRWYGEYPSMWLAAKDVLAEITTRLAS